MVIVKDAAIALSAPPEAAPLEVRMQDGELDEIVAHDCYLHLEQMYANHWWLVVESGHKRVAVNLSAKENVVIAAHVEIEDSREPHQELSPTKEK
jgi:hypothetical protein